MVSGAVLLARRGGRLWALTFGNGFLYVNDDRTEPRFGLRTVLNIVDPDKLLSVGSKVIEDVVVSTSRQASRRAARDVFTIDDTRDILREVVGSPIDEVAFGKQVIGSGALTLTIPVEVAGLGPFLDRIETTHSRADYKFHFAFIDFIAPVQNAATIASLDEELIDVVAGRRKGTRTSRRRSRSYTRTLAGSCISESDTTTCTPNWTSRTTGTKSTSTPWTVSPLRTTRSE